VGNPIRITVILEGDDTLYCYDRDMMKSAYENEHCHEIKLLNSSSIVSVEIVGLDKNQLISLITYRRSATVLKSLYVLETMDEIHDMWVR